MKKEESNNTRLNIFGEEIHPDWTEVWQGMPEFNQADLSPYDSVNINFRNREDRTAFLQLFGEMIESKHRRRRVSFWFPKMPWLKGGMGQRLATSTPVPKNKYPVYVVSKGRWESRLTSKALEKLKIPYRIVIEPQEREEYAKVIDPRKILVLPFSNLGQGSIPARNWIWERAISVGAPRHWILDDNIDGFFRLNHNKKVRISDENPFTPVEILSDRYTNVAISGLNYDYLINRQTSPPPFYLNTRVYSCILIKSDIPYRWRGRYNEDTDLCLRALKDGLCTILFNALLADKVPTLKMTGGNTDELYQGDGRRDMAESLRKQHPRLVKVVRKWGRWQHQVNYRPFKKNKLILDSRAAEKIARGK